MYLYMKRMVVLAALGLAAMFLVNSAVAEDGVGDLVPDLKQARPTAPVEAPGMARPLITTARCDTQPIIDGKLTDEAWQRASRANFVVSPGELGHRIQTCWDSQTLYLAIRSEERYVSTMDVVGEDGSKVDPKSQESVEVFLCPENGSADYYHFVVTADNKRKAEHGKVSGFKQWSGDWRSAVHRGPGYWQVEMAISLPDLGSEPSPQDQWSLAVCRNRRNKDGDYQAKYCWSPLIDERDIDTKGTPAHDAKVLGLLRFAESGAASVAPISDLFPGTRQTAVMTYGLGDAEVVVRGGRKYWIGATWRTPDTSDAQEVRVRRRLRPSGITNVRWTRRALDEASSIEVRDVKSGAVIYASGQLYKRPITKDLIWEAIDASEHAKAVRLEMEAVVAGIEASDGPYERRLSRWEDAKARMSVRLEDSRREALMRSGPKQNGQPAYGIGIASPMTNILPKELIQGRIEYGSSISLQSARNEMEASQVVVYSPGKDLSDVKLTWGGLRGESGAIIGREAVWAAPMGFVKTQQPGYPVSYVGWWPDPILTNLDKFDIVRGDLQPVWYSVRVPEGAAPGVYRGTLTISPANSVSAVIPVELEVWDFTLPREPSLNTSVNDGTFSAYKHENPSPERMAALFDAFDRYMIEHRCNPGELYRRTPPDEKTVARWAQIGVTSFNILNVRHPDLDGIEASTWDSRIERDEIRRIITDTLATAKKYGIEDRAYVYLPDEAKFHEIHAVEDMASWLKAEFPDLPLLSTARLFGYMTKEAAQGLPFGSLSGLKSTDWVCITIDGWRNKHWGDYIRAEGKEVWWYIGAGPLTFPNTFIDDSAMDPRLLMGFMAYAYDPDGFLIWCMIREDNNDKKLTDGPYTDWNPDSWYGYNGAGHLFYPGQDGPITSIRMENWLDGTEDYEYCVLAEKLVGEMRNAGRGAEADRLEAVLKPYADPGNEVVGGLMDGTYTLDPEVVRKARLKIATAIVQARRELAAQ